MLFLLNFMFVDNFSRFFLFFEYIIIISIYFKEMRKQRRWKKYRFSHTVGKNNMKIMNYLNLRLEHTETIMLK